MGAACHALTRGQGSLQTDWGTGTGWLGPGRKRALEPEGPAAQCPLHWGLNPGVHCRSTPLGTSLLTCKLSGCLAPMLAAPDVKGRVRSRNECLLFRAGHLQLREGGAGLVFFVLKSCPRHPPPPNCSLGQSPVTCHTESGS